MGKAHVIKSRGNQVQVFKGLLSVESDKILLIPLATNYDNMYKMMPSREAH